jgi:hypothetical protein
MAALRVMLGPEMDVLWCADPNEDVLQLGSFSNAMSQMCNVVFRTENIAVIYLGAENYPFPIPLVQQKGRWRFDTAAGLEEIQCRRIGGNELAAIETFHSYRRAQLEYAQKDCSGGGKCAYAQRFSGPPGGLTGLDLNVVIPTSFSGNPVNATCSAGNTTTNRGYVFKILKGQGPAASGGRRSYVVNGDMVGGFALAAYPQCYGTSGITSFMMGPDGRVYERILGKDTASWGAKVTEFNPDTGWKLVDE